MALMTETNTRRVGERVMLAAHAAGLRGRGHSLSVDFEHGQWWVTNRQTGAQWSAHDASGPGTFHGFDFEQVTQGDDD
jgi:hypothetical protein